MKHFIDMNNPQLGVIPKSRKSAIVKALEANGYEVERDDRGYYVWHASKQGEAVSYDTLAEMKQDGDNPLNV